MRPPVSPFRSLADTLSCLEMGAVETLIVWENLDITRRATRREGPVPLGPRASC